MGNLRSLVGVVCSKVLSENLFGKVLHLSPPLGMRWVLHSFGLESADVAIGS